MATGDQMCHVCGNWRQNCCCSSVLSNLLGGRQFPKLSSEPHKCPVCESSGKVEIWKGKYMVPKLTYDGKPLGDCSPDELLKTTSGDSVSGPVKVMESGECHGCDGKGWVVV